MRVSFIWLLGSSLYLVPRESFIVLTSVAGSINEKNEIYVTAFFVLNFATNY